MLSSAVINNKYKYINVKILRKCFASHLEEFLSGMYEEDSFIFLSIIYPLA